ncbi:MAG: RecQ family ATP-dependent DNA helicase [Bacteroidota bacterium]|nr:RecQ family ATP-dependent DNA helicase [Bacteroidota bacterium]
METGELSRQILKKYWGHDQFRPLQQDIVQAVFEGNDTLALLPTGGGKSICFQVPAMMKEGICLVVSPLIALMKDQVEHLQSKGIAAAAVFSGMHKKEIDILLDNCVYGKIKFLYVSPERLKTEMFLERAKRMNINLIAVDEAHCISQWGYDFRPAYLEIAALRDLLPKINVVALTATATKDVKKDIQEKLKFKNPKVFQKSFARDNLSYSSFNIEDKGKKLLQILTNVPGAGIVYVRSRKKTKSTADFLRQNNISAAYYHAGLEHSQRDQVQDDWIKNKTRIIVATNAFGMGIDKPDVRVVVHMDLTNTLEAYYQEAGRAGRDEKKAYAVVLFHQGDIEDLKGWVLQNYPVIDFIKKVYQCLANYFKSAVGSSFLASYDFEMAEFIKTNNLPALGTYSALKRLEDEGFIQFNESFFNPSRLMILLGHHDLYKFQIANAYYDPLIKALLRIYGGEIYSSFIKLSENQVAKFMENLTVNEVEKQLNALHQMEVLFYDPKKDKPQVTFLTPRHDATSLPMNAMEYKRRMENDQHKVDSVIHYITHLKRCRSLVLLEYFNEISYKVCGICDICQSKKPVSEIDETKMQAGLNFISEALLKDALSIENLTEKIQPKNKEKFLMVIRLLLDRGSLKYDDSGRIRMGSKE